MTAAIPPVAGVLLAAGDSSRLGQPKQLLQSEGQALVRRAAERLLRVCPAGVTVVTGAAAVEVTAALDGLAVRLVHNPDWRRGMASSLRCGLSQVDGQSCLVMLADQPRVSSADLVRLVDVWQNEPARPAAAAYADTCGAPAVVPAELLPLLVADLRGDSGAGRWLRERDDLVTVEMPTAAFDIDTLDDLQEWRSEGNESERVDMKTIRIEYFAVLREHAGKDSEELPTDAATVAQLFAELEARYSFPQLSSVKAAVNDEFSDWHASLNDGDTVVFIPPVAGG